MKRILGLLLTVGLCLSSTTVAYAENVSQVIDNGTALIFVDVPDNYWAKNDIYYFAKRGIVQGIGGNSFAPEAGVKRAEFAKMLVLTFEEPLKSPSEATFSDVSKDNWSYTYVETSKTFLTGYAYLFCPDNYATREDIAVALIRIMGLTDTDIINPNYAHSFKDSGDISPALFPYVSLAAERGLIKGYEDSTFGPQKGITRAETVTLLNRAIKQAVKNIDTEIEMSVDVVKGEDPKEVTIMISIEEGASVKIDGQPVKIEPDYKGIYTGSYVHVFTQEGSKTFTVEANKALKKKTIQVTAKYEIDVPIINKSSVVSKGVNTDDLGNIISGQYYFSDGQNQYYSTFDDKQTPHIYRSSNYGESVTPIFDGFGWSLVVKDNWLYFSGNQGQMIDGTYNLFRTRIDGSELQTLSTEYCYGMNIYKQWLYYNKRPSINSTESHICRCELDGSNETLIASGIIVYFILFDDALYYIDNSTTLYKANPDGTNPTVISQESIDKFIIGNGKIIYVTSTGSIKTMNVDGSNVQVVKNVVENTIGTINSYNDYIYYTEYNMDFDYDSYSYKYRVHSIDFNGNNENQIYEGNSYGFYINVLNDNLLVLDYARNPTSGKYVAIAKSMTLAGNNLNLLFKGYN